MSKGPRINLEILERLVDLAKDSQRGEGPALYQQLQEEFEPKGIHLPSLRTIQNFAKLSRELFATSIQEQRWSLSGMGSAGIPWNAGAFLLDASLEFAREDELRPEEKYTWDELDILLARWERPEELTNRLAKWLWRLHLTWPETKLTNIVWLACRYSQAERVAELTNQMFDSYHLDSELIEMVIKA